MAGLRYRVHEWMAEHFRSVQFPRAVFIPRQAPPPFFRNQMPLWKRLGLATFGLAAVLLALLVLLAAGLFVWALISIVLAAG